jgi:hypothetical protein
VLKVTPKGFQIDAHRIKPRFVLDSGLKRFAHADKLEAKKAFIKRKKYHLRHLKNKVAFIELVLELEDDFMSSSDPIVSKPWDINNPFKLT